MKVAYSLPMKIAAILLSYILAVVLIIGCVGIVFMVDYDFYTRPIEEIRSDMLQGKIYTDVSNILRSIEDDTWFTEDIRGIKITVVSESTGEILYNDFSDESYSDRFQLSYRTGEVGDIYYEISSDDVEAGYKLHEDFKNGYTVEFHSYNEYDAESGTTAEAGKGYYSVSKPIPARNITVYVYLLNEPSIQSEYSILSYIINTAYDMRILGPVLTLICGLAFIVVMIYLCCAAGHNRYDREVHKNPIDRVPFDIYTVAVAAIVVLCAAMLESRPFGFVTTVLVWFALCTVAYFIVISYIMSLATRMKAGGIIKSTLIYRCFGLLWRIIRKICSFTKRVLTAIPGVWKVVLIVCGLALYELIMISQIYNEYRVTMWVLEFLVLIPAVVLVAASLKKIQTGAKELAGGNIEYQIDTKYMVGGLKKFSSDMNSIGKGLTTAVEDRMKSERFKTELITNVSHDIKTPLTSIINYVDLIKKEKPENENMRQYIEVLERQSSRLKKLIEDLVEASKASTGNIAVNMEPCEVGVILAQTAGEYDEKLKSRELELIVNIPEEPCRIMADGRHLWRVLDNLMNNIFKYAQPGTRVYINLEKQSGKVGIVFRNISKYALNSSSDELLERFARGDASRNTEGSGLGLSIANSLTELQGGQLSLTVDGDLFKVRLTFDEI